MLMLRFFKDSRIAGFGMVVRDSSGKVCFAVIKEDNIDSPLNAEIKAILFEIEVARNNSFFVSYG